MDESRFAEWIILFEFVIGGVVNKNKIELLVVNPFSRLLHDPSGSRVSDIQNPISFPFGFSFYFAVAVGYFAPSSRIRETENCESFCFHVEDIFYIDRIVEYCIFRYISIFR